MRKQFFIRLSGVPATHSLANVNEESVTTADLDDAAEGLGSHDKIVPVTAIFVGDDSDVGLRGTTNLTGKEAALREQREDCRTANESDHRCLV